MNLKEAREQNKLIHFAKEKAKTHPKASHPHFHSVVNSMASKTLKSKKGTSK
jgi:hypothetical protein